jgi:drug/metabolite transporter (DMT)-like permease
VTGALCLVPATLRTGLRFDRRDILPIALLGIGQFGILIALLNYALEWIPAARAALIFATVPLLTMIAGAALGREAITPAKAIGVLRAVGGVALVLGENAWAAGSAAAGRARAQGWNGELAAVGSAACAAVASVLYRPYLRRYPTPAVSLAAMLAAVAFLAPLMAPGIACVGAGLHLTRELVRGPDGERG